LVNNLDKRFQSESDLNKKIKDILKGFGYEL
jgi:hypothetical protein